ncbi:MAG: DUF4870 domain-containing protein [Lysinibacillus sp.]
MQETKVLNALSYFSVIFAPFIVPLVVWIVGNDKSVKYHAKRALISHIIPVVAIVIFFFAVIVGGLSGSLESDTGGMWFFGGFIALILVYIISFIWNIIQGIKVIL